MDTSFCKHYKGDGFQAPGNQWCRTCDKAPIVCNVLWERVRQIANSNSGKPVPLKNSSLSLTLYRTVPNRINPDLVYLRKKKSPWPLPKEVFLHFIATSNSEWGHKDERALPEKSPNLTKYGPELYSIVEMIGGWNIPEIIAVIKVQRTAE